LPRGLRDNFSAITKAKLYRAAGGVCSNPGCRKHTTGATEDGTAIIELGKAAHIEAAAPGGPRYNAEMTTEQRSHADNGIWLCANCADLIDDDQEKYPVATLREWKAKANREAHIRVATGVIVPSVLNFADATVDRAIRAARNDLLHFRTQSGWPSNAIQLSYRLSLNREDETVTVEGMATGLEVNSELLLVSPPGTGKTTSIVQIASAMLERSSFVPLFIPLKEWAQQNEAFFEYVMRRSAFQELSQADFHSLAIEGRLAILLDGWNELGNAAKQRAIAALAALRRNYPLLRIVTSTRREAVDLPFGGIRAEIQPLSEKQQMELAEGVAGAASHRLLQRAWRTPGVRELVAIPLYLSVLLANAPDGEFPETKEELLRLFVSKHDNDPANSLLLRDVIQGVHRMVLTALAFESTNVGDVAMTDEAARRIVAGESNRLIHEGQITVPLQPVPVLDILTACHLLVRSSDDLLSFQHQQFQEWFASWAVERLMRSALTDATARQTLRTEFLNIPHWEEEVLFAIERLSRSPGGDRVAASVIIDSLTIDPMLAAEMVFRSSARTWSLIARRVVDFGLQWHKDGIVDRAIRFMISTGRDEFANVLWTLLSHDDQQIRLSCTNAAPRVRAGVLGGDAAARLSRLSENVRDDLLNEFVMQGDMPTIELAVSLTRQERSDHIRTRVIRSLMFRAADRLATELLKDSGDGVWRKLADDLSDDEVEDVEVKSRLDHQRRLALGEEKNLSRRLHILLHSPRTAQNEDLIVDLISDGAFPIEESQTYTLELVSRRYPGAVNAAVMRRLERGLKLPFGADQVMASFPVVDDGPISTLALAESSGRHDIPDAVQLAGPLVVGRLVDRVLALAPAARDRSNRPGQKDIDLLFNFERRISQTRFEPFAEAILKRADSGDVPTIVELADLVGQHESISQGFGQPRNSSTIVQLGEAIEQWSNALENSEKASRHDFAEIASAIAKLPDRRHLPAMATFLQEDLRRWRKAKEDWRRSGGPLNADTNTSYGFQYRAAIASIGTPEAAATAAAFLLDDFVSTDMAHCLRDIHESRVGIRRSERRWPDFSTIKDARKADVDSISAPVAVEASPILASIKALIAEGTDDRQHRWALDLAFVAFQMPCGQDAALIEQLLALPVPLQNKLNFVTVLVTRGYVPAADFVLGGVREWLDLAGKDPRRQQQQKYQLIDWLQLLPFSDRPASILDGMKLIDTLGLPVWEFRDVLSALVATPDEDVERIIVELARDRPEFAEMHEWLLALLGRNTQSAVRLLFEFRREAEGKAARQIDSWYTARTLGAMAGAEPDLRATLVQLYQDPRYSSCRDLIAGIFSEAADSEALLAMVRVNAEVGRPNEWLRRATESAVTTHRPLGGDSYEIEPVASAELRHQLFSMFVAGGRMGEVAEACLEHIDELRDRYGILDEPRHPDINSGMAWPKPLPAEDA
jgi:hypothetical protein